MNSLEQIENRTASVIIPDLEKQKAMLEEELKIATDISSKTEAEYKFYKHELENFHSDSLHISYLCFTGAYEYELNKATGLQKESEDDYAITAKILSLLQSEHTIASECLTKLMNLKNTFSVIANQYTNQIDNIFDYVEKIENQIKKLNYFNDVVKATFNIINLSRNAKSAFARKIDLGPYVNDFTAPLEEANEFYDIVFAANEALDLLDLKIIEITNIVAPDDLQKFADFSQIKSRLMLDTNFTANDLGDTALIKVFEDYSSCVDIILEKANNNVIMLITNKIEIQTEICKFITNTENIPQQSIQKEGKSYEKDV